MDTPDDTEALGSALAAHLVPGRSVLLRGDIGAGKSHLARSLIRALSGADGASLDIPSPTYTLVQTYDTPVGEVWHADLFRLTDPIEIDELGLTAAFESAICLVEWPDLLGEAAPRDALTITLSSDSSHSGRRAVLSGPEAIWATALGALAEKAGTT